MVSSQDQVGQERGWSAERELAKSPSELLKSLSGKGTGSSEKQDALRWAMRLKEVLFVKKEGMEAATAKGREETPQKAGAASLEK